ncbi:tetratricopeptide repeat protein [Longimicrobium sp.]|uniref:tetratricopeptide repeat protein n=1 Tax=Longimicrobium sp. TaxID=2029185 RepID=UPI002B878853|nr:tetratricopeptide repeat protein [Longimicrobium sp.]HSU14789.1 tetratricopeptide repeat protein [Longimicrobium sp.]
MANAAKLRDQARNYETRGQWREAIDAYRELVESPEGGDVDIGTWNRIGDLHLRVNETERAVQAYEQAVNAYVDVGLYNNAIALCRKVLRLVPGRAQTYLRLGQISAAKGFFADARQNFLEYAERMRKAGKLDASFAALKEFADVSPEPADVRRLLADQLLAHGRKDEAVEQLRLLLSVVLDDGDEAQAAQVREQITAVDPTASTEPLTRQQAAASDELAFDHGVIAPTPAPPAPTEEVDAISSGSAIEYGNVELDVEPLAGLEHTSLDAGRGAPPARAPSADDDVDDVEGPDDLPLINFDAAPESGRGARSPSPSPAADPARFGEVSLDEAPVDFGPGVGDEDDEPLPLIDFDAPAAPPAPAASASPIPDRLEELRARVAAAPHDASAREALIATLHDHGLGHEVPALLDDAHRALAQAGRYRDAVDPISALIRLRPNDPQLLQKRVEYAFRSGDREEQVVAYLALGRHFAAQGEGPKAEAVFKRVLELDPQNEEARASVPAAPARPAPRQPAAPAAPPPPDYVDLGALIMGDEAEATTRFVVEEREPSGDEERDFAEMLAHFRQKVAENIEVEDATSHYDLGLAFKEMGLVDEAISEFQVALRGGANPLATLEILGQCFVEKGQYAVAARVLDRALRIPGASDADLVGVLYQLGRSEEAMGRPRQAVDYYERVLSVDIRFRDAGRRIEALRAATGAAPF